MLEALFFNETTGQQPGLILGNSAGALRVTAQSQ
jgi:hypothetical protein